jgi:hypothetical protein
MDKTVKIGPTLMDKTMKNGLFWTRNEGVMDKTVKKRAVLSTTLGTLHV